MHLLAPEARAFSSMPSSSPSPWPTSAAIATTSQPYFSFSHGRITEVSSPPEYASTIFFIFSAMSEAPG